MGEFKIKNIETEDLDLKKKLQHYSNVAILIFSSFIILCILSYLTL